MNKKIFSLTVITIIIGCLLAFASCNALNNKITITYFANDGSGNKKIVVIKNDLKISNCSFKNKNTELDFAYWNTKADGTGEIIRIGKNFHPEVSVKLYAIWKESKIVKHSDYEFHNYSKKNYSLIDGYSKNTDEYIDEITLPSNNEGKVVIGIENLNIEYLKKVIFPKTFKFVLGAFKCSKIEQIEMNEGLMQIADYSFNKCSLREVNIPSTCKNIGKAFNSCQHLIKVYLNSEEVPNISSEAFKNCNQFLQFVVDEKNYDTYYNSYLFKEFKNKLVKKGSDKEIKCVDGSYYINYKEEKALLSANNIQDLKIPNDVNYFYQNAFSGNYKTEIVHLPKDLKEFDDNAYNENFKYCLENETQPKYLDFRFHEYYVNDNLIKNYDSKAKLASFISNKEIVKEGVLFFNKDKTILIKCDQNAKGKIVVPEGVVNIAFNAFSYNKFITQIDLPTTLKNIMPKAFYSMSNLVKVNIPSANCIKYNAFKNCSKLTDIVFPNNLFKVERYAFNGTGIKNAYFNEGLEYLGENCLPNLNNIVLPKSLKIVDCCVSQNIENVYILNEDLSGFDEFSLNFCSKNLYTNAESISKFGLRANINVYSCNDLTASNSVDINKLGEKIIFEDSCVYSEDKKKLYKYLGNDLNYTVNENVEIIKSSAFSYAVCEKINLTDTVKVVEDKAFYGSNLFELNLSNSITTINEDIISGTKITSIKIPASVTEIKQFYKSSTDLKFFNLILSSDTAPNMDNFDSTCFNLLVPNDSYSNGTKYSYENKIYWSEDKTKILAVDSDLTEIVIPDNVVSLDFRNSDISEINIPDTILNYNKLMFYNCRNLVNVTLNNTVNSLKESMFKYCTNLSNIEIPANVTNIGMYAFDNCVNLKDITFNCETINLSNNCFESCINLKSITLPKMLTLNSFVFNKCKSLEEVILPSNLETIKDKAFNLCINLKSIELPNSLKNIECEFNYLTSITLGENISNIDNISLKFDNLKEFIVNENNQTYFSVDGVLYSKDKTELISYPKNKANVYYAVIESIESIRQNAFYCAKLQCLDLTKPKDCPLLENQFKLESEIKCIRINRLGEYAKNDFYGTTLEIYSNGNSIELYNNLSPLGVKFKIDNKFKLNYMAQWRDCNKSFFDPNKFSITDKCINYDNYIKYYVIENDENEYSFAEESRGFLVPPNKTYILNKLIINSKNIKSVYLENFKVSSIEIRCDALYKGLHYLEKGTLLYVQPNMLSKYKKNYSKYSHLIFALED